MRLTNGIAFISTRTLKQVNDKWMSIKENCSHFLNSSKLPKCQFIPIRHTRFGFFFGEIVTKNCTKESRKNMETVIRSISSVLTMYLFFLARFWYFILNQRTTNENKVLLSFSADLLLISKLARVKKKLTIMTSLDYCFLHFNKSKNGRAWNACLSSASETDVIFVS